jgi:4-alpha-glucanotransferase
VLGLGSEARMNVPGQIGKAWKWKLSKPLPKDLAKRLREATEEANRT